MENSMSDIQKLIAAQEKVKAARLERGEDGFDGDEVRRCFIAGYKQYLDEERQLLAQDRENNSSLVELTYYNKGKEMISKGELALRFHESLLLYHSHCRDTYDYSVSSCLNALCTSTKVRFEEILLEREKTMYDSIQGCINMMLNVYPDSKVLVVYVEMPSWGTLSICEMAKIKEELTQQWQKGEIFLCRGDDIKSPGKIVVWMGL